MNELETKKTKMYSIILFVFRFIMVFFISYHIFGDFWNGVASDSLIGLSVMSLYLLGASLLPSNRTSIYMETVAIMGLIFWLSQGVLISLFVFPLVTSMVVKVTKTDMVVVPLLLFLMMFFGFGWDPITISFSIGLLAFFFVKEYESIDKNEKIKKMRILISKKEATLNEQEVEMMIKDKEIETIMNMFIQLKHLNQKVSIEELVEDMAESPRKLFNAEYVGVYVIDGEEYRLLKQVGNKRRYDVPKKLPMEAGEEEEIINDFLRYPIMFEGKPWGIIDVYGKKESIYENGQKVNSRFNEDDYEKMALYVGQVMFSVAHANTLTQLEEMANNDFLTKIPNRRHFFDKFQYLVNRAKRGEELAVLLLDIDYFKKFNDKYGHDKGDETLIVVAEVLQTYVREMDFVGRLGGEEFGVLIPNSDGQSLEIAERLRKRVSQIPFVEQITVSLGIAYYGKDGTTIHDLYNNADKALYNAKENGRNQISEYDGS